MKWIKLPYHIPPLWTLPRNQFNFINFNYYSYPVGRGRATAAAAEAPSAGLNSLKQYVLANFFYRTYHCFGHERRLPFAESIRDSKRKQIEQKVAPECTSYTIFEVKPFVILENGFGKWFLALRIAFAIFIWRLLLLPVHVELVARYQRVNFQSIFFV